MQYLSNAANGYAAQDELEIMLRRCLAEGYLSTVIKEYRIGMPGYLNDHQFYAPFMIQFNDRQRWIVYSTTSCRTDRIKGQQWDAENLKRLDASIVAALLVYPDDVLAKEIEAFSAQRSKYVHREEFSCIDGILSFGDLEKKIKAREDEIYQEVESPVFENWEQFFKRNHEGSLGRSEEDAGRYWDLRGRSFERELASVLSDERLLSAWKSGAAVPESGTLFPYFRTVVQAFQLNPIDVVSMTATASQEIIGLLPTGGQPKTDVLVKAALRGGGERILTISCKRTKRDYVSAHQYTADAFADVLNGEDSGLRAMLNAFQRTPTLQAMEAADSFILTEKLRPHVRKLAEWVVSGVGGGGNAQTQFAQFVAVYNPEGNRFAIHSALEYVNLMMARPMRHFGTPFQWTYASGQRGRSIQLKMPVIFS